MRLLVLLIQLLKLLLERLESLSVMKISGIVVKLQPVNNLVIIGALSVYPLLIGNVPDELVLSLDLEQELFLVSLALLLLLDELLHVADLVHDHALRFDALTALALHCLHLAPQRV